MEFFFTISCLHTFDRNNPLGKWFYQESNDIKENRMSKPNLRKEIKKKEEFQAKFQLAMLSTNRMVSQWLNPIKANTDTSKDRQSEDAVSSFHDLPIIANGSGLYSLETKSDNKKIADFLQSNEEGLRKLKSENSDKVDRQNGSLKAMNALMNKMRNASRDKARQNVKSTSLNSYGRQSTGKQGKNPNSFTQQVKKESVTKPPVDSDSESDDDMANVKNRSVKKGANLLFDSKIGKKSRKS